MKNLVAYITPKVPSSSFTIDLALSLYESGVDSLEIGVPFTDPVADGAVIETATHKALANGFVMNDLFEISEALRGNDLLWMGYFNPFYQMGVENLAKKVKELAISGLIIPDLPFEEAAIYEELISQNDSAIISFAAPTTPADRLKLTLQNARKFIYLVAYAGITGSGRDEDLLPTIEAIREVTTTPIFVGFGVDRNTATKKVAGADGVIVGSSFVKIMLDDSLSGSEKIAKISNEARVIKELINS